jgi:hypothetical protein
MEPSDLLDSMLDLTGPAKPVVSFIAKPVAEEIRRRRLEAAAEIVRAKMRKGLVGSFRENEAASLIFDFLRAAEDGTARHNLEIMADLIANGVGSEGFTEDAIRHLMKIVAGLSYEELRVLAAFIRVIHALEPTEGGTVDVFKRTTDIWMGVWRELAPSSAEPEPSVDTMPTTEAYAQAFALARTGLVVAHSGYGMIVFGPGSELLNLDRLSDVASLMARAEQARKAAL